MRTVSPRARARPVTAGANDGVGPRLHRHRRIEHPPAGDEDRRHRRSAGPGRGRCASTAATPRRSPVGGGFPPLSRPSALRPGSLPSMPSLPPPRTGVRNAGSPEPRPVGGYGSRPPPWGGRVIAAFVTAACGPGWRTRCSPGSGARRPTPCSLPTSSTRGWPSSASSPLDPRDRHPVAVATDPAGRLVGHLTEAGARMVILDVLYPPAGPGDAELATSPEGARHGGGLGRRTGGHGIGSPPAGPGDHGPVEPVAAAASVGQ